ncbi:class I SAM-dependent methyltransferase [Mesorhizobium sp. Root157]|uniref:class I SAM-dependent methyltransferase n=1 Tax=Mesorhizobium sp. Root157 TaxID=1736477 RepID=UPI000AD9257F|nr:class I SAM-dependent methyltransferase [Mesorhizobium sp. Root157]
MTSDIVEKLEKDKPQFHWGGTQRWNAAPETLREIQASTRKNMLTLETGCGASTVIFAAQEAHHTVISPTRDEHQRVADYLRSINIDTSNLKFEAGFSDDVLPNICSYPNRMNKWDAWCADHFRPTDSRSCKNTDLWREDNERHLDFIFLDGAHSFPYPIIDWHYSVRELKIGGHLLLDDIPIPAVACVYRYMITDPCWKLIHILDNRAAKFELVALPAPEDYTLQPYNRYPDFGFLPFYKRNYMLMSSELRRMRGQLGEAMPSLRGYWRRMRK